MNDECEIKQVRCIEFLAPTLGEVLQSAADWAKDNPSNKVNIWAVSSPHYNSSIELWGLFITFVYWNDRDDPTL